MPDHHFKAGNLNYAHGYVEGLPGGPAPFIAALDADMIPSPEWLRALLPHIIKDEKLALVQPPQVRNLPVCYYYHCYILFHPHQRARTNGGGLRPWAVRLGLPRCEVRPDWSDVGAVKNVRMIRIIDWRWPLALGSPKVFFEHCANNKSRI